MHTHITNEKKNLKDLVGGPMLVSKRPGARAPWAPLNQALPISGSELRK